MSSTQPPAPSISNWEELAKSKRESVFAKIPKDWLLPSSLTSRFHEKATLSVLDVPATCGILTPKELDITSNYDATDLLGLMAKGELKSIEVVTAFCKRAAIAQQCCSCLTEIMFDEALARARECDTYLAEHGKPMGPMHGLPISLKDSFNVRGVQGTLGYVSFLLHPPSATNSVLVDVLYQAGAVFYVKTNLPQGMMSADSHNNVFGRTLNPHNLTLTAGGSTGGEAALSAMRGSILGASTDIAGSSRIPPLCCGVLGIKPTASRVPFGGGVAVGRLGSPGPILPVSGVCGHSVRDFGLFLKTALKDAWQLDETSINVPWRVVEPVSKPLRFGLLRSCKERPLHPPMARALHTAATALKAQGHTVVLLDDRVPDVYQSAILAFKCFMLDPQGITIKHILASGEPFIPSRTGSNVKELDGWKASLDELWDMNLEREKICSAWRQLLVKEQLDAVLCPGYQSTSVPHDTYGVPVYTVLFNLLNVSCERASTTTGTLMDNSIRRALSHSAQRTRNWMHHF